MGINRYPEVVVEWPFPDDPETGTYVSRPMWEGREDLRYVLHDHDGDWQFLCGTVGDDEDDILLICLVDVVRRFPTVGALAKLPVGWEAEFHPEVPEWTISPAQVPED